MLKPSRLVTTATIAVVAIVAGCDRDDSEPVPEGELIYQEDFSDGNIGDEWEVGVYGGDDEDGEADADLWQVVDGTLHVQGAHNRSLWLQEPLPDEFRVSFTARSESAAGDIKFAVLGDGREHTSGYIGIFGGWNNSLNIIARQDEHGDDRIEGAADQRVHRGQTYQMDVVRTDHRLRWYVDDELFLTYDDSDPLGGDDHRYFAFSNWDSPLYFDDLRIYDLEDAGES